MIIYLLLLCCQPSSAITTIVINEGSIYQPASTPFLFLPAPAPISNLCFISSSVFTPLHPSILPSLHPSFPLSHIEAFFVSAGEMLPVTPELQTPIQAAGGGPAAVNQSVACVAEGMGVDT